MEYDWIFKMYNNRIVGQCISRWTNCKHFFTIFIISIHSDYFIFIFYRFFSPYKYASYRISFCLQYWPTILNKKFDFNNNELSVTLIQEEILSNNTSSTTMIIMRTFQIHPNDLIVRQFHLKNFSVGDDGTTSGCGGGGCSTTKILSTKTSSTIRSCYELIELREKLDQYSSITSTSSSSATSSHPLVVQCM